MSSHGNVDQTRDVNDSSAYLYEYKLYLSLYLQIVLVLFRTTTFLRGRIHGQKT